MNSKSVIPSNQIRTAEPLQIIKSNGIRGIATGFESYGNYVLAWLRYPPIEKQENQIKIYPFVSIIDHTFIIIGDLNDSSNYVSVDLADPSQTNYIYLDYSWEGKDSQPAKIIVTTSMSDTYKLLLGYIHGDDIIVVKSYAESVRSHHVHITNRFDSSVKDGMVVYKDETSDIFRPAIANNGKESNCYGIAFPSWNQIITSGIVKIPNANFEPNKAVYLSKDHAGQLTQEKTLVKVGFAIDKTTLILSHFINLGDSFAYADLRNVDEETIQNSSISKEILKSVVLGDYVGSYHKEITYTSDGLPKTIKVWKDSSKNHLIGSVNITYNSEGYPIKLDYSLDGKTFTETIHYDENGYPIIIEQSM